MIELSAEGFLTSFSEYVTEVRVAKPHQNHVEHGAANKGLQMIVPESIRRLPASQSDPDAPASEYGGYDTFCAKFSKMMAVDPEPTLDTGCTQGDDLGDLHCLAWARSSKHTSDACSRYRISSMAF
jgi:hypothetical protein